MHKHQTCTKEPQPKSNLPVIFLQKLISVNPSKDFSRQFGIGRYFFTEFALPNRKKSIFWLLGKLKNTFFSVIILKKVWWYFLLPTCVEIKTILRELLFTVDNCLDNYAGIPCFATNMQPKTALKHIEHIEQLNKTEKCIYQIWVLCIISDSIFPKHVCINFPFRLKRLQKVCMISIWMQ